MILNLVKIFVVKYLLCCYRLNKINIYLEQLHQVHYLKILFRQSLEF